VSVSWFVVPVPLSETACGLPGALSLTESVPFRLPATLGVKVTLMVQLAPDAIFEPLQVSVSPKLAVTAMLAVVSVVVP
jgi:hypothetical protein